MTGSTAPARRRPSWRPWAAGLGLLLGLQFVFFGLLVAAQAVPDRPIVQNLLSSVEAGTYGPNSVPDRMGGVADTFTECVLVGTGLGAAPDESAFSRAVRMPRIASCAGGEADLRALAGDSAVAAEELPIDGNYFRYWAGYTLLTRPVLALFGLEGLRIVSGTLMVASLAGAFLAVRARTSVPVALALTLPFLVGTNMLSTPSTSFSHSLSIAAAFLSVLLTAAGAGRSTRMGLFGAALGAAVFCYVDLLTTPAVPWIMSAFVLGAAVWCRTRRTVQALGATVTAGVVWVAAFAVTWVSRWTFAVVFLGLDETLSVVRGKVAERTGGEWDGVSDVFGAGVRSNVEYWWNTVPTSSLVLLGCTVAALVGLGLAVARGGPGRLVVAAVLGAPALVVPVWYIVLSNHSQIHEFFVNRNVPAALAVATAAALVAAARPRTADASPEARPGPASGTAARSAAVEDRSPAG
ncbi:hypothetical protein ACH9DO_07650 [Kocuria sp. M1N1S27]|uniref:hypothetical protein n=1 Tax=Kocuria kalidii TaxID=3376283 RepID=UPI00379D7054